MNFLRIKRAADAIDQQLEMGKKVELEHGTKNPDTNVTDDDPKMTEQIARAHLKEDPKYYTHLKEMEDKYVEKKGNGDESGGNPIDEMAVQQWLKNNPNPEDSAVHQFASEQGYNKHALEEVIYRWASEHLKESAYREGALMALQEAGLLR